MAYGPNGKAWETLRLSWEGIKILEILRIKSYRPGVGPAHRP